MILAAMTKSKADIAAIGTGYWGKNHVRVLAQMDALGGLYDSDQVLCSMLSTQYKGTKKYSSLGDALGDSEIKGFVISTPAETHYEIAKAALEAGKDVLVEKPLALKYSQAQELVDLAREKKRILMVGHLLQYHPAVVKLHEMVLAGELGRIEYIYSNRLNLGKIRREENILWSFAPHDISIMLWMMGAMPIQVSALGGAYLQPNIADTTISTYSFDNGVKAHIYVSWLHPFKEQRLVVVGEKKMAVFDDRAPQGQKLLLFEKKVSMKDGQFVAEKPSSAPVAYDESVEPLRAECSHFLECIRTRNAPRTDGQEGARVLKVLQSCQRSLNLNGQPVQVLDYHD